MAVALLASVPEEHIISGLDTVQAKGRVAFGSKDWELFSRLDALLHSDECDVLIFASEAQRPINPPTVTWKARYITSSLAINGAHKEKMTFRPKSTERYPLDNKGSWIVFWEVSDLKPLNPGIRVSSLRGFAKPNAYLTNFIPHGPLLIQGAS
jgi:hypothetical protein